MHKNYPVVPCSCIHKVSEDITWSLDSAHKRSQPHERPKPPSFSKPQKALLCTSAHSKGHHNATLSPQRAPWHNPTCGRYTHCMHNVHTAHLNLSKTKHSCKDALQTRPLHSHLMQSINTQKTSSLQKHTLNSHLMQWNYKKTKIINYIQLHCKTHHMQCTTNLKIHIATLQNTSNAVHNCI